MKLKTKVAFVSAPYRCFDKYRKGGKHPNNGTMILGGELLEHNLADEVRIFDGAFYNTLDELIKDVRKFNPLVLGIPGFTDSMPETQRLFNYLGDIPVKITGGPYSTARSEELLTYSDVVFFGEAEQGVKDLLKSVKEEGRLSPNELKEIKGIVFRERTGEIN